MLPYITAILAIATIILLALLYRHLPNRRIFWYFCFMLAFTGFVAYVFVHSSHPEPPVMSAEEKYEMQQQQHTFMIWYADYQKDIDQLDHNWQLYHSFLEAFKEDAISVQTAYVRLKQLEDESRQLRDRLAQKNPPLALNDTCYDLLIEVMQKTRAYAEAQYRTIARSRAACDPIHLRSDDQKEQSRSLQDIMIRESPTGLFTASEISAIRNYLTIPEEDQ